MGSGTKGGAARATNPVGSGSSQTLLGNAAAYGATSASSSSTDDPPVYLGQKAGLAPGTVNEYGFGNQQVIPGITAAQDDTQNLSTVSNQYYQWDDKTRSKFLAQLSLAGVNVSALDDASLAQAWASYAEQSSAYYKAGTKMTPWDIMARDRMTREAAVPTTTTSTNLAYDVSSRADAHALFLQATQSLLGRAPTKGETGSFLKQLNVYEKKNPTKTTSTTTTTAKGNSSSTSTSSGGVSAAAREEMAAEEAKQGPEYGAYQASTTYMNALLSMLGG